MNAGGRAVLLGLLEARSHQAIGEAGRPRPEPPLPGKPGSAGWRKELAARYSVPIEKVAGEPVHPALRRAFHTDVTSILIRRGIDPADLMAGDFGAEVKAAIREELPNLRTIIPAEPS